MKRFFLLVVALIIILATNVFSQLALDVVWEKPSEEILDAKFSPDGKFVYCAIGADIKKLDVQTGEFVATFDRVALKEKSLYLELSPDGKHIITLYYLGGLYLWDTELQKVLKEIRVPGMLENQSLGLASFLPDNRTVLLTLSTHYEYPQKPTQEVLLYDLVDNLILKRVSYNQIIQHLHTTKDGTKFITGSVYEDMDEKGHCKVALWDAEKLEPVKDFEIPDGTNDGFWKIQISDNNKLIGVALVTPIDVKIYDTETGQVVKKNDNGKAGGNFELLQNDYFLMYQEASFSDYGIYAYKYPDIYQSFLANIGGRVFISKEVYGEDENKFYVFIANPLNRYMLTKSTSSTTNNPEKIFYVKVDQDMIIVKFDRLERIKIVDMKGNTLYDMRVNEPVISIPNIYPAGNYLCVLKSGNKEYTQKFQVVR